MDYNYRVTFMNPDSDKGSSYGYHTLADAKEGFSLIVAQNPKCYAVLSGECFSITLEEYDGMQDD